MFGNTVIALEELIKSLWTSHSEKRFALIQVS